MTDVFFLDTETTIHNTGEDAVGKMSASPHSKANWIVHTGVLTANMYIHQAGTVGASMNHGEMMVAHNLAFDLLHLLNDDRHGEDWLEWTREGTIWDTMLVEYLLTGQQHKWASLDQLSKKYGGTIKDSRMKEYWEQGISTEDIPLNEILPYLEHDVRNLEIIYKGQLKEATAKGMLPLIHSQMSARLATIMMEYHGMKFDLKTATIEKRKLEAAVDILREDIEQTMISRGIPADAVKATSAQQLSCVLFGGTIQIDGTEVLTDEAGQPLVYKGGKKKGQVKTRKCKIPKTFSSPLFRPKHNKGKNGYYPVGEDVLAKLPENLFVETIREFRELNKALTTYFDGYSKLVFPHDGCIHGNLNHCQTNTGRLSSSSPNMQNISNKEDV